MIKEINYRSYNEFEKCFYYFRLGTYYRDSKHLQMIGNYCDSFNWYNAECSTRLKDKNGVDIYEGDILRVNTKIVVCEDDDLFGENKLTDQEITCYVSYTEKFAAFELITIEEDRYLKAWGFYGEEDSEDFIVIGNIHSNPELIK